MAVFAVEEFDAQPTDPAQYEEYFDVLLDARFMQFLAVSLQTVSATITGSGANRVDNVTTIDFTANHAFIAGEKVTVAGVTDSTFNGTFFIDTIPSSTSITYLQSEADAGSGNGTVDPVYPEWTSVSSGREVRDSVRFQDILVRSKYAGRDYQTFLDEGISWLRENFGTVFTDFADNDVLIIFAKYVSAALDTLSWYLDKETTEFYFPLLTLRSRAEALAKFLGYKPRPAVASSVDLDLTLTDGPYAFDVPVDINFQFQGPNDLVFESLQQIIFSAGEVSKTTQPFAQGTTIEDTFVATGKKNLTLEIEGVPDDNFIAKDTVVVTVDGVSWTVVDFLSFDQNNEVEIIFGGTPPFLVFGNGVVGNVPDEGLTVLVTYRATRGKAGLAATTGTIENPVNGLVVNFQTIPISANNPDKAIGGDDPETLDEIKANAPQFFKTADRGVTQEDVTELANQFSGVAGNIAKARANIVRGIEDDFALQRHLDNITADQTTLEGALDAIDAAVTIIGTERVSIQTHVDTARTAKSTIDTEVTSLKSNLDLAETNLNSAKASLDRVAYQQIIAEGDGVSTLFSVIQLDKIPVASGSVSFVANELVVDASGVNGDLDTSPGVLRDTTASAFTGSMVGRVILIGNQLRQVTEFIDADNVRYSGGVLSGTGVSWTVYDAGVPQGIDDGNGGFTGVGIVPGGTTIDYSTGIMSVQFVNPLGGNSSFGVSVICQYSYEEQSARTSIDSAITDISAADTDADDISTETTNIETELTDIEDDLTDISTQETVITVNTTIARAVPDSLEDNIEALTGYLDEHLSDEGQANIVIVQALVVDENGFYAKPTQALLDELKTQLLTKNVVPTTVATVSGFRNVLAVTMKYRLKVLQGYQFSEVVGRASPLVDDLFRGRTYGASLFRASYYNLIVPDDNGVGGIEGVDYADITIESTSFPDPANDSTPPSVDSNGNLVITGELVLTKGTITFEQILT